MTWDDVLADPTLQDLPYKIELNERGQIVMSPGTNLHSNRQFRLGYIFADELGEGEVFTECSVFTRLGVKVPDVAWASRAFLDEHGYSTPYAQSPEICAEVRSPSNTWVEMREKIGLYLEGGAREVWICEEDGRLRFFSSQGEMKASILLPDGPSGL
jgi:Uma2 family endonuclease